MLPLVDFNQRRCIKLFIISYLGVVPCHRARRKWCSWAAEITVSAAGGCFYELSGFERDRKCCRSVQGKLHHAEVGKEAAVGGGFLVEGEGIGAG